MILTPVIFLSVALAAAPQRSVTHQALRDQCLVNAADATNPWALAHGITGIGLNFLASDGRKASTVIMRDFLLRNRAIVEGKKTDESPYGFLHYGQDGTPIEPHPNLHVKTLVMAGVPLSTKFETSWGKAVTLDELVRSVKWGFRHSPKSPEYWASVGWTLDVFSYTTPPGGKIETSAGPVSIDEVMDDALTALEAATAELKAGMDKGLPQVDKRKQGLYAHPCGGLHFEQAVLGWARHPAIRKKWGDRVEAQMNIVFYRLESEARQYQAALQAMPQHKLQILTQMVKFYGHFLETTARFKSELKWKPNELQLISINRAKAYLDSTVRLLMEAKAFESMPQLKSSNRQVYLDLIGDSCHATHGLDLW